MIQYVKLLTAFLVCAISTPLGMGRLRDCGYSPHVVLACGLLFGWAETLFYWSAAYHNYRRYYKRYFVVRKTVDSVVKGYRRTIAFLRPRFPWLFGHTEMPTLDPAWIYLWLIFAFWLNIFFALAAARRRSEANQLMVLVLALVVSATRNLFWFYGLTAAAYRIPFVARNSALAVIIGMGILFGVNKIFVLIRLRYRLDPAE